MAYTDKKISGIMKYITVSVILTIFSFSVPSAYGANLVSRVRPLLNTLVEIKLWGPDAEKAADKAFAEITRVGDLLNNYDPESEVSKINRNAGKRPVSVSFETMDALEKAKIFCELSGGALDFTIGPLVKLWGFAGEFPGLPVEEPGQDKIDYTKALVDYRQLELEIENSNGQINGTAFLMRKGMYIDVGSFGKGYIADRAINVLRGYGIENALVAAGGTICAMGKKPDGTLWSAGIRHPRNNKSFLTVLTIGDRSVSTSGDYEKFFKKRGKIRTHIIDPRTGIPVESIQSATVTAPDGMASDSLSTALFVLGAEDGIRLIESLPDVEALIVSSKGDIVFSKGWPQKEIVY